MTIGATGQPDGRQRPLTVVAKIRDGQENLLLSLLTAINRDIADNAMIRFSDDRFTHFARWFIVDTPGQGSRLVFAATFSGKLPAYINEIMRVSPGLDEIWGKCEGYVDRASFPDFVRSHAAPTRYFFCAYPDETVTTIRTKAAIRQVLEELCDLDPIAQWLHAPGVTDRFDQLASITAPLTRLERFARCASAVGPAVADDLRQLLLPILNRGEQLYADFREPKEYPQLLDIYSDPTGRRQYLQHSQELADNVSRYQQNQLTVVAPVAPHRLLRLRLALFLGWCAARYGYPPGQLSGTYTIHSLHWVIIDNGRTGMFMSNYDGSWENYLDDFADNLLNGINALLNNTAGYPAGGLHRVEAWAQFVRNAYQIVPLYYSAYPDETVAQIGRDRSITASIQGGSGPYDSAKQVLSLL